MADITIDGLPAATEGSVDDNALVPGIIGGADRKIPLSQIKTYILGALSNADLPIPAFWQLLIGSTNDAAEIRAGIDAEQVGVAQTLIDGLSPFAQSGDPADFGATVIGIALLQASTYEAAQSAIGASPDIQAFISAANSAAALAAIGGQPSDSDLTAIASLSTTSFGRSFLTLADAAAARTLIGAQPADSDLTAIAALTTTTFGRAFLTLADAAAARTAIGAGTGNGTSNLALASTGTPADLAGTASRGSTGTASDAGHVHKAPGATSGISAALGSDYTLTATAPTYNDTGISVTLPAIGTYDLFLNISIKMQAGYTGFYVKLRDVTTGVDIVAMPLRLDGTASEQVWTPSFEVTTAATNRQIKIFVAQVATTSPMCIVRLDGSRLRYRLASAT